MGFLWPYDDSDGDNSSSSGDESATSVTSKECGDDSGDNDPSPGHPQETEGAAEHGTSSDDEPLSKLARDAFSAATVAIAEYVFVIVSYTLQHSRRYYVGVVGVVTKVFTERKYGVKFLRKSKL